MGEKSACGKSTQELLLEFQQTGSQAPFEEIARRYAGMVYNVALHVTKDAHDAEDATQATFLTLAVHAKTAGKIRFVGPWLRKVSQRLALDIRRSKKRRTHREQRHAITHAAANGNGDGTVSRHDLTIANSLQLEELRDILRNELDKLPTKYRMPLVLYYFGGLTPEQIGKELKCKTSTLGVRLHRGRKMLADSLSSRGISINSATAGVMLAALVDSSVRDNLVHACTHAAVQVAARGFVADALVSAPVLAMANSVTSALRLSRLKGIIAAGVLLLTTITGTAAALERFEVIRSNALRMLNPLRLLRPLMDRLLHPGTYSLDLPPLPADHGLSQLQLEHDFSSLNGSQWPSMTASLWPSPHFVTGAMTHVGSERLLASQYESPLAVAAARPVVLSNPAPVIIAPTIGPIVSAATKHTSEPVTIGAPVALPDSPAPIAPASAATIAPTRTYDTLIIDRAGSSSGLSVSDASIFTVSTGTTHARKIVVGDSTDGMLVQTGGTLQADEAVVIANKPGSTGTYLISNDSTLKTPRLVVGGGGTGSMFQSGGQVTATTSSMTGNVVIGDQAGSEGEYVMNGGSLVTDHLVIGRLGVGTLRQDGGVVSFQVVQLGSENGGKGTWSLSDGSVQVNAAPPPAAPTGVQVAGGPVATSATPPTGVRPILSPMILIGGEGAGTFLLRSNSGTAIHEEPGRRGAALLLRPDRDGTGVIRGWGRIELTGPFITNGRVIADGFGLPHVLDLSTVSVIMNFLDNPTTGGMNGWYAREGGSLKLPVVRVNGSKPYTWGEFSYDRVLDLVNSVRFTPHDNVVGEVDITLLDPLSHAVPLLPTGHGLSLWEIDGTIEFSGIDLLVRYDDVLISMWRYQESDLALWVFESGAWSQVTGETAGIDLDANLIWGTGQNPQYFAVGLAPDNHGPVASLAPIAVVTPEPLAMTGIGIVAAGALMRRRRR